MIKSVRKSVYSIGIIAPLLISSTSSFAEWSSSTLGNVLFLLHHQVGHALIELHSMPIEDVERFADTFAMLMILDSPQDTSEPGPFGMAVGAQSALQEYIEGSTSVAGSAGWTWHGMTPERYQSLLCLVNGFRDENGQSPGRIDMTEKQSDDCVTYLQESYRNTLSKLYQYQDAGDIFLNKGMEQLWQFETIYRSTEVYFANIPTPLDVSVSIIPCGKASATWERETRKVVVCEELVGLFEH